MTDHVADRVRLLREVFATHPELAKAEDTAVTVRRRSGLHFRATDVTGRHVDSGMPVDIGGEDRGMSPGTLLRAALGTCDATTIALEAAARGIDLSRLEVDVTSTSDHRGLLDVDGVTPGPQRLTVHYRLTALQASEGELESLVEYAERCSPVASALRGSVPVEVTVEAEIA